MNVSSSLWNQMLEGAPEFCPYQKENGGRIQHFPSVKLEGQINGNIHIPYEKLPLTNLVSQKNPNIWPPIKGLMLLVTHLEKNRSLELFCQCKIRHPIWSHCFIGLLKIILTQICTSSSIVGSCHDMLISEFHQPSGGCAVDEYPNIWVWIT